MRRAVFRFALCQRSWGKRGVFPRCGDVWKGGS